MPGEDDLKPESPQLINNPKFKAQFQVKRIEQKLVDVEKKWALAALARLAEKDEIPENEPRTSRNQYIDLKSGIEYTSGGLVADVSGIVGEDNLRISGMADFEGRTTRDSNLRQRLREIARLTSLTQSQNTVVSFYKSARFRKEIELLKGLRQERIINLSPEQLEEADWAENTSLDKSVIRGQRIRLEKYLKLTIGDLYDSWGLVIAEGKNTAQLASRARNALDETERSLRAAIKSFQTLKTAPA